MPTETVEAPAAAPVVAAPAPAAEKPAAAAPAAESKPVAHDYSKLAAPKGSEFNAEQISKHAEWAKAKNLDPTSAQAALDLRHEVGVEALKAFTDVAATWPQSIKDDAELGGKNYETTIKNRDGFLTRFAKPEDVKDLTDSGWLNYPPFVRMFSAAGAAFAEKPSVSGGAAGATPSFGKQKYPDEPGMWSADERRAAGRLLPGES